VPLPPLTLIEPSGLLTISYLYVSSSKGYSLLLPNGSVHSMETLVGQQNRQVLKVCGPKRDGAIETSSWFLITRTSLSSFRRIHCLSHKGFRTTRLADGANRVWFDILGCVFRFVGRLIWCANKREDRGCGKVKLIERDFEPFMCTILVFSEDQEDPPAKATSMDLSFRPWSTYKCPGSRRSPLILIFYQRAYHVRLVPQGNEWETPDVSPQAPTFHRKKEKGSAEVGGKREAADEEGIAFRLDKHHRLGGE